MSDLLRFAEVACWRGGRLLFSDLSFELGAGDGLWLRGPNGVGKSSALRLAAGLLKPLSGTIEAAPAALADEALALDRELPLRRALRFWTEDAAALDGALKALDLSRLADVPVRLLSTGQARRARLARVAASGAQLWLLDEPLSGLDADSIGLVAALIERHRAEGGAVLATSHQPMPGAGWRALDLAA
ncbi:MULTISPECIES: heme ABC exporter ATP-binding protein CcmA [Sphingomonas]|uniref:heme ABC exporter ATP-binding protein CcmA n=1 Tax=Sphingomonas TaxID=13687 RepID=UPI000DEEAC75|nr:MULTISPECIES: heme ABC exporter ATP-binding protein CcmA [Sphingomonas]